MNHDENKKLECCFKARFVRKNFATSATPPYCKKAMNTGWKHDCRTLIILAILVVLVQRARRVVGDATPKTCPSYCKCDTFDERNRAICSAKNLIFANVEIPAEVEVLDLSYNEIAVLDDNCFQSYRYLVELNTSRNDIHTIYLNAFSGLRNIRSIDLSHNRLEYLDERLFESNRRLLYLNLEGNKLMSLENRPLIMSPSLASLNLRNSQVSFIYSRLFSALPRLEVLDLSCNLMITINATVLSPLRKLKQIDLSENRWIWDSVLTNVLQSLQKRGVSVVINDHSLDQAAMENGTKEAQTSEESEYEYEDYSDERGVGQFERMQMMSEKKNQTRTNDSSEDTTKLNWRRPTYRSESEYYDDHEYQETTELNDRVGNDQEESEVCESSYKELCLNYHTCLNMFAHMAKDVKSTKQSSDYAYTKGDLLFVFTLGGTMGVAFSVLVVSITWCIKGCLKDCKGPRMGHREAPLVSSVTTAVAAQTRTAQRPPVRTSRRRASPPQAQTRAVVRHSNYTGRDNFLNRLFGRPARHQYYRAINENTAILVRRLSRSNLFNNRLSQHFSDRGGVPDPPSPTTPTTPDFNVNISRDVEASYTSPRRPETPPPKYGDVVKTPNLAHK